MREFNETLYDGYSQGFSVERVYFEQKTDHQHLLIFHNAHFGRVMVLDGIVQTTERDEFIYHETLTHTPIFAHGAAKRVLIIGGGDGGMLREVVKHRSVDEVVQVEIDQAVIDMSRTYLPNHSAGAFDDPRVRIVIDDGKRFVTTTEQRFDVIISDSTDPIGPGEALFTSEFYAGCKRCLNPGGVLVTQNGVVYLQPDEVTSTAARLNGVFGDWAFFSAAVPTYVGGIMAFAWASDDSRLRQQPLELLAERFANARIETRYYNPAIHRASFALPQYVVQLIEDAVMERSPT
jgi:spermidine synthase